MSATPDGPAPVGTPATPQPGTARRGGGPGAYVKPTIYAVLLAYLILFVALNREAVQINFVFATATVSMIFALLVTFVVGALLAAGLTAWSRRRATRSARGGGR